MSRTRVWAYVCKSCGHYTSQHRATARSSLEFFQCGCGCTITQDSPSSVLQDRPADETPYLPSGGDQS